MYWINNSEGKQIETTPNLLVVDKIGTQKSNQRPGRINIDVYNPCLTPPAGVLFDHRFGKFVIFWLILSQKENVGIIKKIKM